MFFSYSQLNYYLQCIFIRLCQCKFGTIIGKTTDILIFFFLPEVTINRLKEKLREYEDKMEERVQVL